MRRWMSVLLRHDVELAASYDNDNDKAQLCHRHIQPRNMNIVRLGKCTGENIYIHCLSGCQCSIASIFGTATFPKYCSRRSSHVSSHTWPSLSAIRRRQTKGIISGIFSPLVSVSGLSFTHLNWLKCQCILVATRPGNLKMPPPVALQLTDLVSTLSGRTLYRRLSKRYDACLSFSFCR